MEPTALPRAPEQPDTLTVAELQVYIQQLQDYIKLLQEENQYLRGELESFMHQDLRRVLSHS